MLRSVATTHTHKEKFARRYRTLTSYKQQQENCQSELFMYIAVAYKDVDHFCFRCWTGPSFSALRIMESYYFGNLLFHFCFLRYWTTETSENEGPESWEGSSATLVGDFCSGLLHRINFSTNCKSLESHFTVMFRELLIMLIFEAERGAWQT